MTNKRKKHEILGGVKVSSEQLSKWGSLGGRPQQYSSNAERQRAKRLRKKQERLGKKAELRDYKSYGEIQVEKRSVICPNCGKVENDLRKYFDEKGKYIPESYWFDTVKMEKTRIKENKFYCDKCLRSFSFVSDEIEVEEVKKVEKRAGSGVERVRRWRGRLKGV